MFIGLISGLGCALFQSLSYICSAVFMRHYRSSLRLVIFSQLAMGIAGAVLTPLLFPPELLGRLPEFLMWLLAWAFCFSIGQLTFFTALRSFAASRMSSLLGLKVVVLALICVICGQIIGPARWVAVALTAAAGVAMNWSGGVRFKPLDLLWLLLTLVFYSFTDMIETKLVCMPASGNVVRDSFGVGAVCYLVLGLLTLPLLKRFRFTFNQLKAATPFAVTWYLSQMALFICFGTIGTVFGNVVQASRGVISVLLGWLLMRWGLARYDTDGTASVWMRRLAAAVAMMAGIALYALAEKL